MKRKRIDGWRGWLAGGLVLLAAAAGLAGEGKRLVFASVVPQAEFVARVGGERVRAEALVQPGENPHTFEPSPRQLALLAEAALYFRVGISFENGILPKLRSTMKNLRVVDTRRGIKLREMGACTDPSHQHDHEGTDPHIWTCPRLAKVQARTIADALIELDPAGKADYERNLAAFVRDLDALDHRLTELLEPVRGRTFMVFHPAWGYFADTYGLQQQAIEVEGKTPGARQLARIIDDARQKQVRVIFTQPQFSTAGAEAVAKAIDATVAPLDPEAQNYFANMKAVGEAVAKALGGPN